MVRAVRRVSWWNEAIKGPVRPVEGSMDDDGVSLDATQNPTAMAPRFASQPSFSFTLLACFAAACASGSARQDAPARAEALVTMIERVHVEAERSRLSISEAFERLNALAAGRFDGDPAAAVYARFVQATDEAAAQAKRLRDAVGPMLEAAKPVFEQWQADVLTIGNERLRQRGELRLAVAKERYEAIRNSAQPALARFDGLVKDLQDHAAFLAHDLNAGAIDDIQPEVKAVAMVARTLDGELEACHVAARAYVEQSAAPAGPGR